MRRGRAEFENLQEGSKTEAQAALLRSSLLGLGALRRQLEKKKRQGESPALWVRASARRLGDARTWLAGEREAWQPYSSRSLEALISLSPTRHGGLSAGCGACEVKAPNCGCGPGSSSASRLLSLWLCALLRSGRLGPRSLPGPIPNLCRARQAVHAHTQNIPAESGILGVSPEQW